jgi:hypothetical protein
MKILALISFALLAGCASKEPRPVLDKVCFSTEGLDESATRLARKAAKDYLSDYRMQLVDVDCEANIRVVHLRTAASSERSLLFGVLVSPTNYASLDGTVTISVRGTKLLDDSPIVSSKYTSTLDAINDFVWQALKPLVKGYRASV